MANALDRDLVGCVVLVRADVLKPEFADPEKRKFKVEGGFGARSYTIGTKIFGTWVHDGSEDVIRGYDVEAVVVEPEPGSELPELWL